MTITAIAPWFGAKRSMAQRIVTELGKHSAYWEPFCGSMAVLIQKPISSHEHVIEKHGDLVNLARTIKDPVEGPKFYRQLRRTMFSEALFYEAKVKLQLPFSTGLDRALDYFTVSWMGRNGVSGTKDCNQTFARRWTPNGGQGAKRFASAVDSIPAWRRRMRAVNIEHADSFEAIPQIVDQSGVVIYCDPPYYEKGAEYEHDFTPEQHVQLAKQLSRFTKTRVVVSYYDHPVVRELYQDWTWVMCDVTKALVNQGMRDAGGAVKAPEVLLINGPSYTEPTGQLF